MPNRNGESELEDLRRVLAQLTRQERLVCIWKRAGFSSRDIATFNGQSVASVNRVYARARRKLRDALNR